VKAGEDNPQARDADGKTNIYLAWSRIWNLQNVGIGIPIMFEDITDK